MPCPQRARAAPCPARPWAALGWLAAVLVSAGCAAPTPPKPVLGALSVPADWSAPGARRLQSTTSLVAWWTRFQDPLLVQLVEETLARNTRVQTAQQVWAQARALSDLAAAGLRPSVQAVASAQRSRQRSGTDSSAQASQFNAGLDASWETDLFHRLRAAVAASQADAQASQADLGAVQVTLAAEVALDYLQLRAFQARLAVAEANALSQQKTAQIARWRQQAGLLTVLEVAQAETAWRQTQALLPALATAAQVMAHSLAVLTHRPPADLTARLASPGPALAMPEEGVWAFPAETLRQRADVRAAEWRVDAAYQRVAQADAARYPDLQLSGSLGLSALGWGPGLGAAAGVYGLLASVSAPLLDGGAARAQLRAQQALMGQAVAQYDGVLLTALAEVEGGLVTLQGNRERVFRLRGAEQTASHAARLAQQRFASGLVDFQVVLETQRSALSTQDALVSAQSDWQGDHVRLYKALGGGWEAQSPPAPPTVAAGPRP
ncbi:efflux transporter outer membrane subunit [Curvibacter sp. HBC28]|uniref:Efflux transporter outer membrane subunit n=1 Tax=Curvibacter microcysteis TaxID=3026419 RepID=A0ABT5MHD5_9BURK|nr:efflux transporter outer membrane subunit [Curvibacter sp. HBC28]MDD0815993.1 efflux transporter outer membrane subunit [Curvibacter sp. HBC28]